MKRRAETDKVESHLLSIGRIIQSQFTKRGLATILFGLLAAFYALFIIDYLTDIPYLIRLIIVALGLLYALYYLNKRYLKQARVRLSAQEVSLRVEQANPHLQSRFISMLQFQSVQQLPGGVSENLVDGMVEQTFDQLRDIDYGSIIDHSWIKKHLKRIALIALLIVATIAIVPNYTFAFVKRFIDPSAQYPTRTQIESVSVADVIPAGDDFVMTVKAGGDLPEVGSVTLVTESSGSVDFELNKTKVPGEYTAKIGALTEKAEMTVYLGDDKDGPRTVTPTARPTLKSLAITVKSPAYTAIADTVETSGNIRVIKGSALAIQVEANKKLKEIHVVSETEGFVVPQLASSDGIHWTMNVTADQNFTYQLLMTCTDGLHSVENASYQVSVMTDRPPVIRIDNPKGGAELAPVSKMPLQFKVNDDIGIDTVFIKYAIISGNGTEYQEIDYNKAKVMQKISGINRKTFDFDGIWDNTKLDLRSGDSVYLWVEATDKAPAGHSQRSASRQITIVGIDEYRNRLLKLLDDNVGKVDAPIIDLKDSARKLGQ